MGFIHIMRSALPIVLFLCVSCSSLFGPDTSDVNVSVFMDRISIHNNSSHPVYTVVIPTADLPLADWIPCTNPQLCDGIAPGVRRLLSFPTRFHSTETADEAAVYWWHLVPTSGGGFVPDSLRVRRVRREMF